MFRLWIRAFLVALGFAALPDLGDSVEAGSIGKCGGGGGDKTKSLLCPAGKYAVGLFVRGGYTSLSYVDRIGIACAGFNAEGVRGTVGTFSIAGGSGGSSSEIRICGGNSAIAKIHNFAGGFLDKVDYAVCVKRKKQGGFEGSSSGTLDFSIGGSGGSGCSLICPNGEALRGLKVKYGAWVDSIEAFCEP